MTVTQLAAPTRNMRRVRLVCLSTHLPEQAQVLSSRLFFGFVSSPLPLPVHAMCLVCLVCRLRHPGKKVEFGGGEFVSNLPTNYYVDNLYLFKVYGM
jgi:hypothetical protein